MIYISNETRTGLRNPENLIYIAFLSVFVHFIVTALILIVLGIYLLANKNYRSLMARQEGKFVFVAFTLYTVLVALYNRNFIGVACSFAFFLIIIVSSFVRATITEKVFDRCLDLCCYASVFLGISALIEKLLNSQTPGYSCKLWFFNENYFCAVAVALVLICAYKATSHKGPVLIYYICAVFGLLAMYLGESMFAFVELFVGLCVLLILKKKHLLLAAFLMAVVVCLIIVFMVPDIFPRLSESGVTTERRIRIWNEAMPFIKENPLFGRGFLSYYQISGQNPSMYQTTHTHNFAIEFLLSFGIIGTFLLIIFLWTYYHKVSECKELLRVNCATTLILTISSAVIIHMTTDMTLMWIQTGLLYGLIMGGLGVDEQTLNRRINACLGLGGKSDSGKENK